MRNSTLEKLNEEDRDEVSYDAKEKHINVTRILDYDAVQIMNEEQIYEYMIRKFLKTFEKFQFENVNFQHEKFQKAIQIQLMILD